MFVSKVSIDYDAQVWRRESARCEVEAIGVGNKREKEEGDVLLYGSQVKRCRDMRRQSGRSNVVTSSVANTPALTKPIR